MRKTDKVIYRPLTANDTEDVVRINNLAWGQKEEKVTDKQIGERILLPIYLMAKWKSQRKLMAHSGRLV